MNQTSVLKLLLQEIRGLQPVDFTTETGTSGSIVTQWHVFPHFCNVSGWKLRLTARDPSSCYFYTWSISGILQQVFFIIFRSNKVNERNLEYLVGLKTHFCPISGLTYLVVLRGHFRSHSKKKFDELEVRCL